MNYKKNTNPNTKSIEENEWGSASRLTFSTFTSCIGVVGYSKKSKDQIWGMHLVQAQTDFFANSDAEQIKKLAIENCEDKSTVQIFGCINAWQQNPAYKTLKESLQSAGFKVEEVTSIKDDGTYTTTYDATTSKINIAKS